MQYIQNTESYLKKPGQIFMMLTRIPGISFIQTNTGGSRSSDDGHDSGGG